MLNQKITYRHDLSTRNPGYFPPFRAIIIALAVLPLTAGAGVYKWVDEQGKVHYGSQRPENQEAERLNIKTTPRKPYAQPDAEDAQASTKANEKTGEKNAPEEKPQEETTGQQEQPKEPELSRKEKRRLCTAARERVAKIESRGRLKATDDKGVTRHLTDAERNSRLKEARADVAKYCR